MRRVGLLGSVVATIVLAGWTLIGSCSTGAAQIRDEGPTGGIGGGPFNTPCNNDTEIGGILIFGGAYIDSIRFCNRPKGGFGCGGMVQIGGNGGGQEIFLILNPGEFITAIVGKSGVYIDSTTIVTNQRVTNGAGGPGGTNQYVFQTNPGEEICGFWGRSGSWMDALGVHMRRH